MYSAHRTPITVVIIISTTRSGPGASQTHVTEIKEPERPRGDTGGFRVSRRKTPLRSACGAYYGAREHTRVWPTLASRIHLNASRDPRFEHIYYVHIIVTTLHCFVNLISRWSDDGNARSKYIRESASTRTPRPYNPLSAPPRVIIIRFDGHYNNFG